MTFVQLKYILTIAETKSLNKAAEQLYVSQPLHSYPFQK